VLGTGRRRASTRTSLGRSGDDIGGRTEFKVWPAGILHRGP